MENENTQIPEHLSERWKAAELAMGAAAIRLTEANVAYHDAIVERLKLSKELKNWQMHEYFGIDDYIS